MRLRLGLVAYKMPALAFLPSGQRRKMLRSCRSQIMKRWWPLLLIIYAGVIPLQFFIMTRMMRYDFVRHPVMCFALCFGVQVGFQFIPLFIYLRCTAAKAKAILVSKWSHGDLNPKFNHAMVA